MHQRCAHCRSKKTGEQHGLTMLYTKVDNKDDASVFTRSMWHKMTCNAAKSLSVGFYCMYLFNCRELISFAEDTVNAVRAFVEPLDGYEYATNRNSNGSFCLYCSQYRHHSVPSSLQSTGHRQEAKTRNCETKRIHACEGYVPISKPKKGIIVVRFSHKTNHESAASVPELSSSDIGRIKILTDQGLAPFQIYKVMQYEGRGIL